MEDFIDDDTAAAAGQVVETTDVRLDVDADGDVVEVNGFHFVKQLGSGAYGTVHLCEKINASGEKQSYAAKVYNKASLRRKRDFKREGRKMVVHTALEKVQTEIAIMKKLHHHNLVRLFEVIDDDENNKLFMILENVEYGQIMDWDEGMCKYQKVHAPFGKVIVREGSNRVIPEEAARGFMKDIIAGLHYLHLHEIAHRDIKPDNILLGADSHIKIADFGVAHIFGQEDASHDHLMSDTQGTYHFLAPECMKGGAFDTYKADNWALGVTLFSFLCGSLPFWCDGGGIDAVMTAVQEKDLEFPAYLTPEAISLLSGMMAKDPSSRLELSGIMEHEWMHQGEGGLSLEKHEIHMVDDDEIRESISPRSPGQNPEGAAVKIGQHDAVLEKVLSGSEAPREPAPPAPKTVCEQCLVS